jgi:Fe-S-cluster containining protein
MKKKSRTSVSVVCSRCTTCCTLPLVPVTADDVERLCALTGMPPERIVRFYPPEEMEYDAQSGMWIQFARGKRSMGLRKRKGRCMFLSSKGLCRVYSHRPMTCRTFPYDVEFSSKGTIRSIKLNRVLPCSAKRVKELCHDSLIMDAEREFREDETYYDTVETWNANNGRSGSCRKFLAYLGLC